MDGPLRQDGPRLARLLGNAMSGAGPLYLLLSEALRSAIDRGEVAQGTVLPPERTLARELSVSRSTVVAAYDRLKVQGWLESRQGSGTWVRRPPEADRGGVDAVATGRLFLAEADGPPSPLTAPALFPDDVADLSVAATLAVPMVHEVLKSLGDDDVERLLGHHGYVPHGLPELRHLVARRFTDSGLRTHPDQIVVSNGAHQALSLVARQTIQAGDTILVESPTFPGALDVFRRFGAQAVPLPVDDGGARADLLEDLVARVRPSLIYLAPTFHNPTGVVMDESRRRQVAEIVDESGVILVEDLTLADLALDDVDHLPPIAAYTSGNTVHTIGSMSKVAWAGLRVGWVRSAESWSARMLSTKTVADLGSPVLDQLVASRLLERGDELLAQRRADLAPRRDLLCHLLANHLPDWTVRRPRGGLSAWVTLPNGNALEYADLALRHGVAVVPGPSLSVDDGNRRSLRIVFARPEDVLRQGVERLAAAWAVYRDADQRSSPRLLV